MLRFHIPLVKPDVRISRIRLSPFPSGCKLLNLNGYVVLAKDRFQRTLWTRIRTPGRRAGRLGRQILAGIVCSQNPCIAEDPQPFVFEHQVCPIVQYTNPFGKRRFSGHAYRWH